MKIKADDLAATVEKTLSDYVEDVNDVVKQEIKDAGKEAVKELKEKSPKRRGIFVIQDLLCGLWWGSLIVFRLNKHSIKERNFNQLELLVVLPLLLVVLVRSRSRPTCQPSARRRLLR